VRTIAHISDLHFGAADDAIVAALRERLDDLRPSLVAVSGDLTQRARRGQFAAASRFLRSLPYPQILVPGNHDVPLYNLLARFYDPLGGYRRHITRDRFPVFVDGEIAVVGADTTRSFTVKDGGLTRADVERLVTLLDGFGVDVLKAVVCHHPFDPLASRLGRLTIPAPDAGAVARLVEHGADLFLTGHRHLSYTGHTAIRYRVHGSSAIVVEAGTATSTRARGELNSFNVVRVEPRRVSVERLAWTRDTRSFDLVHTEAFVRTADGWT
jgi:3',5'-cyclic AMP phosphodiesterase CpdA